MGASKAREKRLPDGGAPASDYIAVLYIDTSDLPPQMAATFDKSLGDRVKARLKELKKKPSDLGRFLGYAHPFDSFYKLFVSGERHLTKEILAKTAEFLDWPLEMLSAPENVQTREARAHEEFEAFLREGGSEFDPDVLRTLRSMKFYGQKVPNRIGFQMLAMMLLAVTGDLPLADLVQGLALRSKLDAEPTPPKPTKNGKGAPKRR
jgi:hypothetical protein